MPNNKILAKVGKDQDIFIALSQFNTKKYLDIRKYYDNKGEMCPTSKGITLDCSTVDQIRQVLNDNFEEIEKYLE